MELRYRARALANWLTLGTPLGLAFAVAGGCSLHRGPRGTYYAVGYRRRVPDAAAFTVGNVIVVRQERTLASRRVMAHEERHTTQWAVTGGIVGFPLAYAASALWSLATAGDYYSRNPFERLAGLADGGYPLRQRSRSPVGLLRRPG